MSTYRHLVYMVLDELKVSSDDAYYTEDHIVFLLTKYRAMLLKQRYSDVKRVIPESNFQTVLLDLVRVPAISGEPCEGGDYLRTVKKIPFLLKIGSPRVYPIDYYQGDITFVSRDRMRYVGYNKFMQNIIYTSLAPNNYLYFKSSNPQFLYLEKVKVTGVFEDPTEAAPLLGDEEGLKPCYPLDMEFPLEEPLIPQLIQSVVKELSTSVYRPEDKSNDDNDDLSEVNINSKK